MPKAIPEGARRDFGAQHTDFGPLRQLFAPFSGSLLMSAEDRYSPWWSAERHADLRPFLLARSAITRALRTWFESQGFTEVETGILQVSPGNETHLHAPRTELTRPDGARLSRYLRSSPEFACKKLLAGGETG